MNAIPDYKPRTDAEIRAENERLARIPIQGAPVRLPQIAPAQRIASLKDRVSRFKTFPVADDMPVVQEEQKPTCPVCDSKGAIKYRVPIGDPRFGQLQRCPDPDCPVVAYNAVKRMIANKARVRRHFGDVIDYVPEASMSDYAADDRRRAVGAARIFLEHGEVAWDGVPKRSLVFFGAAGRGKTWLVSAMYNTMEARNQPVEFHKVLALLKGVQRGYDSDAEMSDNQVQSLLMTIPCLFIDEMETMLKSGDRTDIFEAIIDHRCRENLPTIIATNLAQDEVRDVWNDRVKSRLVHMAHWIEMTGPALRNTNGPITNSKK